MNPLPFPRRLLKWLHPEGIPWLGSVVYNRATSLRVSQWHYERVAREIVASRATGSALDVGAGPGWLLLKLHEFAAQLRLAGMDISPSMVPKARQNAARAGLSALIEFREGSTTPKDPAGPTRCVGIGLQSCRRTVNLLAVELRCLLLACRVAGLSRQLNSFSRFSVG
jgi:SAM-dependent methyltransferase